jgi:hypothetical protein
MSVKELENAVTRLAPADLVRFRDWFERYTAERWDREFEADVAASKLDRAGKRAERDYMEGRCTRL